MPFRFTLMKKNYFFLYFSKCNDPKSLDKKTKGEQCIRNMII